jgi:GNAT superfamily N-acetyltransferase
MVAATFADQERRARRAYLDGLGGEGVHLDSGSVAVLERPEPNWGYLAVGAVFSDRTIFSVAPEHVAFVRRRAGEEHRHQALLDVLSALRDELNGVAGPDVVLHAPGVCWVLGSVPDAHPLPPGHRLAVVDEVWLNDLIPTGRFENGAGQPSTVDGRAIRNLYGVAVHDDADEVVALAGAFNTYGLHEIGVDVVADRQGEGLGRAVVSALAREILDRGAVPFYGCNPSNIRSMRTALSVGFVPVCADASITH